MLCIQQPRSPLRAGVEACDLPVVSAASDENRSVLASIRSDPTDLPCRVLSRRHVQFPYKHLRAQATARLKNGPCRPSRSVGTAAVRFRGFIRDFSRLGARTWCGFYLEWANRFHRLIGFRSGPVFVLHYDRRPVDIYRTQKNRIFAMCSGRFFAYGRATVEHRHKGNSGWRTGMEILPATGEGGLRIVHEIVFLSAHKRFRLTMVGSATDMWRCSCREKSPST